MPREKTRYLCLSGLFVVLFALSARFSIPIFDVPITLQTTVVLLCGLLLPTRYSFLSVVSYLLLGLIGLPVFSKGGGFSYALSPTFGYLLGFLLAVPFLSSTKRFYQHSYGKMAFFCFISTLLIHLCGGFYYYIMATLVYHLPNVWQTILTMTLSFWPLDIVKLLFSTSLAFVLQKRVAFLS